MSASQLAGIGTNAIGLTTAELSLNFSSAQIQALSTTALSAIEGSSNHTALIQSIQTGVLANMTIAQLFVLNHTDMTAAQLAALSTLQRSYLL